MSAARPTHSLQTRVTFLIVGLLILLAVYELKVVLNFVTVKHINCELDSQKCPASVVDALKILEGKSLFLTDYSEILREQGLPLPITLKTITKELPQTLNLTFVTQPLAYQLFTNEGMISVSESGLPFKENTIPAPVTIELTPPLASILASPTEVQPAVHQPLTALSHTLQESKVAVKKITWVDKDTIILIMNEEQQTAVLDVQDPQAAVRKLELIAVSPEYQAVEKNVREIDLRFNLPVLRMKQ
jgi:hypothetical protein